MPKSRYFIRDLEDRKWGQFAACYGDPPNEVQRYKDIYSDDLITSRGNHHQLLGGTNQRIGGDFLVVRRFYRESSTLPEDPVFSRATTPTGRPCDGVRQIIGGPRARSYPVANSSFPTPAPSSDSTLRALGTVAISRVAPNSPEFDASTALGELREGAPLLPGIQRAKAKSARGRNLGDEYLNVEFGWKPVVRDIQKFARTVRDSEEILDEFARKSGVLLKRKYRWDPEFSTSESSGTALAVPHLATVLYQNNGWNGTLRKFERIKTERWFEGAFMYHLPVGGFARRRSEANKLLGTDLTPRTVWNLAPWSWAADWCGNMGDVMNNLSNFSKDHLIMPWAYVMERRTHDVEYTLTGIRYRSYPGEQTFRQSFTTVTKKRVRATPFGFGFDMSNLSPRQAAILAALGASRT